jgi:adenylate kinase family enzyme
VALAQPSVSDIPAIPLPVTAPTTVLIAVVGTCGAGKDHCVTDLVTFFTAQGLSILSVGTGDLCDKAAFSSDDEARRLQRVLTESQLSRLRADLLHNRTVDSDIVLSLLGVSLHGCQSHVAFNGFPRLADQVGFLGQQVNRRQVMFNLQVTAETALFRISRRIVCLRCRMPYTPETRPNSCHKCGGEIGQRREDQNATNVSIRIAREREQLEAMLKIYRNVGTVYDVSAEPESEEVAKEVIRLLCPIFSL